MVTERSFGSVSVLFADNGGVVPYGNSVVVPGSEATMLIDPSLALDRDPVDADIVMISHAHEDHMAGLRHCSGETYAHRLDAPIVGSLELLLDEYDFTPEERAVAATALTTEYHLAASRDGVHGVDGDHVFDLGGRRAQVIHLPGHTAGHCGVLVEPDGFFYVADIDLSSFGPFYGDRGSDLDDFLASLDHAASVEARWYATFHHKGVVEGREEFATRIAAYRHRIVEREERLVAFLTEPRTLDDIVDHRLVYRPHVTSPWVRATERRTAELHLERLVKAGAVHVDDETGLIRTVA
ncbi:MBL fold metallo-hydrolase [Gordonia desulfuricans]|uniref:MBL fold metallo-hydrolase n=1 Tax=Gordonia desulfuricans TaxID=89051 RepID=A0A7K3LVD2_9ACTN|nr:MBL fold metallo-hydrolase [Gordonia desulfuricans]NDK91891.1 MBL fold metallo-hydrolase [Gordonia desulfuricans]